MEENSDNEQMSRREFFSKILLAIIGTEFLVAFIIFLTYPLNRSVRTSIPLQSLPDGAVLETPSAFIINEKGKITVFSIRCPHLGCALQYQKGTRQYICPCHGSRFDEKGRYISGPAQKNMTKITPVVTEDEIIFEV